MTVACSKSNCYYYQEGMCSKEVVSIDNNAMCGEWWRKGQPRSGIGWENRVPLRVIDGEVKEYVEEEEDGDNREESGISVESGSIDNDTSA